MKINIFNYYSRNMDYTKVQDNINDFIKDKEVIDIKVSGTIDDYGYEMFQYVVIYKEKEKEEE